METARQQRTITWSDRFFATASWCVSNLQERVASNLFAIQSSQPLSAAEHFDRVVRYSLAALHATYQAINPPEQSDFKGTEFTNYILEQRERHLANAKSHWGEVWQRAKEGVDVDFLAKALIAVGAIAVAPRTLILSTALTFGFFRFTTSTKEMIFEGVDRQKENAGNLPLYAGALYSALLLSWKVLDGTPSPLFSIPLSLAAGVALGFSISKPDQKRQERFTSHHDGDYFREGHSQQWDQPPSSQYPPVYQHPSQFRDDDSRRAQ